MKVEELKKAMHELIKQGYSQLEISLMLTEQFVRGDTSKAFYIACLHMIGVDTKKMEVIEEEELRKQLYNTLIQGEK